MCSADVYSADVYSAGSSLVVFAANTRRPTFNSLDADRPRVDATQLEGVRDLHECFVAGPRMWRVGDDGHETKGRPRMSTNAFIRGMTVSIATLN